ncbi:FTR1 family iron permease [Poseidonibacter lekithochrous]|uniref:FTR1 family iron permease n=1 Tax=Poseidonibacter lekithochrous TaxID=1904463 RepID=UPI000D379D64|nr:FTR1 family protein [Poseidonibacter lekithochrous]
MLASFLITFREGLEAFLIVGIILSYLGKLQATKYKKFIYLGVLIGVVISIIIAYIFQVVIYGMDNETYQHYLMIFILLFATLVLSYMVVWMANQSKQIKGEIEENIKKLVTAGNIAGMVFLAFLAVLREGFETVLFFSSLSFSESITLEDGLIGAFSGLVLSIVLVYFLMRGAKNIPIKSFFKYTGLLILIIAGGLFGSAVSMMQAADLLPTFIPVVYDISFILDDRGLFGTFLRALFGYNSSPTFMHLISWAVYMSTAILLWRKTYSYAK